jgi:outer membrane protein
MKRLQFVGCVVAVLFAGCFLTASAQLKLGFINAEEIFKNYTGTKEAQDKFDKEVAKWEQDATNRQKEMKEIKDQLDKQSLLLSAERKAELEAKHKKKQTAK